MWAFYCYDDGQSPDIWRRWLFQDRDVSKSIQARHDVVIGMLRQQDVWNDGDLVHGLPVDGLVEIVLLVKKDLQWRIAGMYGPKRREFTVLGFFYHKGSQYRPKGILSEIESRRDEVRKSNFRKATRCEPPSREEKNAGTSRQRVSR